MKRISDFLGKFAKITQDSDTAREAVVFALKSAGIRLEDPNNITIRGTVVTLKLNPSQKSEVFLKQKKILAELGKHPLTSKIAVVR